jgi:hypothetical protein
MTSALIGIAFGLLAAVFLAVGLLPLLGWLNWITSLPLAFVGLIFSRLGARSARAGGLATVGTLLCSAVIVTALARLALGGGVF